MTELVMLIRQVLRINEMMTCHFVLLYVNIHQFTTHNFIISKSFNRISSLLRGHIIYLDRFKSY